MIMRLLPSDRYVLLVAPSRQMIIAQISIVRPHGDLLTYDLTTRVDQDFRARVIDELHNGGSSAIDRGNKRALIFEDRVLSRKKGPPCHQVFACMESGGRWEAFMNRSVISSLFGFAAVLRSEEHTSELQSRRDLVCRLLLEKKKKHKVCS